MPFSYSSLFSRTSVVMVIHFQWIFQGVKEFSFHLLSLIGLLLGYVIAHKFFLVYSFTGRNLEQLLWTHSLRGTRGHRNVLLDVRQL